MGQTEVFINSLQQTGPVLLMPAAVFLVCLFLRIKPGRALLSSLNAAIGLVGVSLLISMIGDELETAMQMMSARFGLSLAVLDIGWAGTAPAAWASPIGALAIPLAILINMVMLASGLTRTVNIDIWNIWHMAFTGAIAFVVTGSYAAGIGGMILHAVLTYKLGDFWGDIISEYFGMRGLTVPHGTSAYMAPFAVLTDTVVEHIKPLREIDLTADALQEKIGVFAEPSIAGFVIGTIIGLLAGFRFPESLMCGVKMGAFMLLIPRVVKCIMDGLIPIQERVRELAVRKFKGTSVFIGMDPAILLGDPTVMKAGILLVPITILLAVFMPGNRVLPLGDLATISFFIAIAAGIHHGNLFRTLLSGTLIMYITIWIANRTSPWVTSLLSSGGMLEPGQAAACLDQGGCPITYLFTGLLSGESRIGIILIGAPYLAGLALAYRSWKRNAKELP